jgi:calcineurin-like phosphoesterase family protein
MNIFFASDAHFGHANIAKYCRRPSFKPEYVDINGNWISTEIRERVERNMNARLIAKWNSRVNEDDVVYHIGDFCNKGRNRGVDGSRFKGAYWEEQLNGKIIHILGNHDGNNGVKPCLDFAQMTFANMKWFLIHKPPYRKEEIPEDCDAVLCGHVHELWDWKWVHDTNIPMINVGMDVRKYAPIKRDEIVGVYSKIMREANNGT